MKKKIAGLTILIFAVWLCLVQTQTVSAICNPALPLSTYLPNVQSPQQTTMGNFYIIRPEVTTNLLTNPSPQLTSTNYTASGGAIARTTALQKRGAYSMSVLPTSATADGMYYGTVSLNSGTTYTFSVDVLGVLGVPYRIYFASTAPAVLGTPVTFTGTGAWQRVAVTYTEVSSTTRRLYIVKNSSASTATFYVDGLQLEALAYDTTYCDGSVKDCLWTSAPYQSTSTRAANVRSGGRKIDLTTLNAFLVSQSGTGMGTVANLTTPYASLVGSFLNKQAVKERSFTISFSTSGDGTQAWHQNRQALIDLTKPDLVYPGQPFVLVYDGGGKELRLSCYYDGGLEMSDGTKDIETVGIKCLAPNPYWKTDGVDGAVLSVQQTITNANRVIKRAASGSWSSLGTGLSAGVVNDVIAGPDGSVYITGSFTTVNGVSASNIAKWNGTTFVAMGTGLNSDGYAMVFDAAGNLYVTGNFSLAGGVANTAYVAKWNGSVWSPLGTGLSSVAYDMAIDSSGNIYVTGTFTTAGGGAAAKIAKWNGSAWSAMGTGLNSDGESVEWGPDGNLYAAGNFSLAGGVANTAYIAKWNGSAWLPLGQGLSAGGVQGLAFGKDGTLYATGLFATASGTTVNNVAQWNGSTWKAMGSGLGGGQGYSIDVLMDGTVVVGGSFTTAGGITLPDSLAMWNGSAWTTVDIDLPSSAVVQAIYEQPNADIFLGFSATGGSALSSGTTVVTNDGSAESYPIIVIKGPSSGSSRIYQIENLTTGLPIYLNYTIQSGETATLNLTPGAISFSSDFQGNLMSKILPGSKTSGWALMPGVNTVNFFAADSTVTATVTWIANCWSIDSSGS